MQMLKSPRYHANRQSYQDINRRVKRAVKVLKEENMENKIKKMEADFIENNSRNLFKTVRELEGKPKKSLLTVKDVHGDTHNELEEVLKCWEDHFNRHLNTEFNHNSAVINELIVPNDRKSTEPEPSKEEIRKEIKAMKFGKNTRN